VDDHGTERALWLGAFVALVLAPVALLLLAPGDATFGTAVAAGLGFTGLTILSLQAATPPRVRGLAPFGREAVLRFHRQVGALALALVVGHVVVLIADDPDHFELLDVSDAPFRAQAGIAAVALLLALTALARWRSWWRGVHLVLGMAVLGLAFAHVVGEARYVSSDTALWAVLLVAVGAAGVAFYVRVTRPFAPAGLPYRVRSVTPSGGLTVLALEPDGHAGMRFEPGQYARVDGRPFWLASGADEPPSVVGEDVLEPGTTVLVDGPHGGFRPPLPDAGYVLVCGGVGIAPALSLIRTLAGRGDRRPVRLVLASRTWDEVPFREELEELERGARLRVGHVLDAPGPDWAGERGPIAPALLRRVLPADAAKRNVLVCGPPGLTASAANALLTIGIPEAHIRVLSDRPAEP
jgi:predicted ferric reductase